MRRILAIILAAITAGASLPAIAVPAWPGTESPDTNGAPAIGGYDPVAYFSGNATLGKAEFTAPYAGATFRFASPANRDAFTATPDRYTPQFGGHCAWAASQGRLATPDPKLWKIVDGKLYLNCSTAAEEKWLADVQGNIARGNAFWATQQ